MDNSQSTNQNSLELLYDKFSSCDDFRDAHRIDYPLAEILFLTFCASMCNSSSYQDISDFGELKLNWLRKFSPYKNGIPSHDTIGRILSFLNTKQLQRVLTEFCSYGLELPNGTLIHIDGKRLRGSATTKEKQTKKSAGGKQAAIIVNAYCSCLESSLSSIEVDSKTNEKNALKDILGLLNLSHCIITLDAGYCHTDAVEQIIDADANYVIGLKNNQPKLLAAAKDLLSTCPATETHTGLLEDSHGRLEKRTAKVLNFSNLDKEQKDEYWNIFQKWKGLMCLMMVSCQRTIKATNKTSIDTRYFIASLELLPQTANGIVRKHWHVENKLHWVLDAIFGEDSDSKRAGASAQNFSLIRKISYNKLKALDDPKVSMRRRIKKCALDENYLEKALQVS